MSQQPQQQQPQLPRQIPSLLQLALQQAPVQSPQSRAALDRAAQVNHLDLGTMELVNDAELSHLTGCRGRVPEDVTVTPFYNGYVAHYAVNLPAPPPGKKPSDLDGQLASYCPRDESFVVRLDAWINPAFWAEVPIPLPQLQAWLREQGVEMEYRVIRGDDNEDEEEEEMY